MSGPSTLPKIAETPATRYPSLPPFNSDDFIPFPPMPKKFARFDPKPFTSMLTSPKPQSKHLKHHSFAISRAYGEGDVLRLAVKIEANGGFNAMVFSYEEGLNFIIVPTTKYIQYFMELPRHVPQDPLAPDSYLQEYAHIVENGEIKRFPPYNGPQLVMEADFDRWCAEGDDAMLPCPVYSARYRELPKDTSKKATKAHKKAQITESTPVAAHRSRVRPRGLSTSSSESGSSTDIEARPTKRLRQAVGATDQGAAAGVETSPTSILSSALALSFGDEPGSPSDSASAAVPSSRALQSALGVSEAAQGLPANTEVTQDLTFKQYIQHNEATIWLGESVERRVRKKMIKAGIRPVKKAKEGSILVIDSAAEADPARARATVLRTLSKYDRPSVAVEVSWLRACLLARKYIEPDTTHLIAPSTPDTALEVVLGDETSTAADPSL